MLETIFCRSYDGQGWRMRLLQSREEEVEEEEWHPPQSTAAGGGGQDGNLITSMGGPLDIRAASIGWHAGLIRMREPSTANTQQGVGHAC